MNRVILIETKVKVMKECLRLENVAEIAAKYDVSPGSVYSWYNKKLLSNLGNVLKNDSPGPAAELKEEMNSTPPAQQDRPEACEQCGSKHIRKDEKEQGFGGLEELFAYLKVLTTQTEDQTRPNHPEEEV